MQEVYQIETNIQNFILSLPIHNRIHRSDNGKSVERRRRKAMGLTPTKVSHDCQATENEPPTMDARNTRSILWYPALNLVYFYWSC